MVRDELMVVSRQFSVNGLAACPDEAGLLEEAFFRRTGRLLLFNKTLNKAIADLRIRSLGPCEISNTPEMKRALAPAMTGQ